MLSTNYYDRYYITIKLELYSSATPAVAVASSVRTGVGLMIADSTMEVTANRMQNSVIQSVSISDPGRSVLSRNETISITSAWLNTMGTVISGENYYIKVIVDPPGGTDTDGLIPEVDNATGHSLTSQLMGVWNRPTTSVVQACPAGDCMSTSRNVTVNCSFPELLTANVTAEICRVNTDGSCTAEGGPSVATGSTNITRTIPISSSDYRFSCAVEDLDRLRGEFQGLTKVETFRVTM